MFKRKDSDKVSEGQKGDAVEREIQFSAFDNLL